MYHLNQFASSEKIINEGHFNYTGSAKTKDRQKTLCYAVNLEYAKLAVNNKSISCIIITEDLLDKVDFFNKGIIIDNEPELLFSSISNTLITDGILYPEFEYSIDKTAIIDPTAMVSKKCKIGKGVVIGRYCIINDYTIIDDNVIIGDNVVIGCDGAYFKRKKNKKIFKILHAGGVHIKSDVEVMTGSMIQRAHDIGFTTIDTGTKISVNVVIAHSCLIGKNNIISGGVHIAGRTTIKDNCWIGMTAMISDNITIGNNAEVKIGSVVVKNVRDNEIVSGNFAMPHNKNLKNYIREIRI